MSERSKEMAVGVRIASMREYRGLTQGELGKRVGVSKQAVCGWEKGARLPDAMSLRRLCLTLGCTSDYLIGLSNDPGAEEAGHGG